MNWPQTSAARSIKFEIEETKIKQKSSNDKYFAECMLKKEDPQESNHFESLEPISDSDEPPAKKNVKRSQIRNRTCKLCGTKSIRANMKNVTIKEDKQFIMIAKLLRGESIDQKFMAEEHEKLVCCSHFGPALEEIYKALHIEDSSEINTCSTEVSEEFMKIVNSLFPFLIFKQFIVDLAKFAFRNKHMIGIPSEKTERVFHCKVCKAPSNRNNVKDVSIDEEKRLIIIGSNLLGNEIDSKEFMKEGRSAYVCHSHFNQTIVEICKVLQIENLTEIDSFTFESIEEFMKIAVSVFPQHSFEDIISKLRSFEQRNKYLLQPQTKVDDKTKPKSRTLVHRTCKLCRYMSAKTIFKNLALKEDHQLIMIASALCGVDVQEFTFYGRTLQFFCRSHFEEALLIIQNALHIENLSEIDSCSPETIQEFMKTVNSLFPELSFEQFYINLRMFSTRNIHSSEAEEVSFRLCGACGIMQNRKIMKTIRLREDSQLIVIGSFLQGNPINKERFAEVGCKKPTCHSHFQTTIEQIYYTLNIRNISEIDSCPPNTIQEFMKLIISIFPHLTFEQVVIDLRSFVKRNEHLIAKTK